MTVQTAANLFKVLTGRPATATLEEVYKDPVLWDDFRHDFKQGHMTMRITAIHGLDDSTREFYQQSPGCIRVSYKTPTGGSMKAMLPKGTVLTLTPER